MSFHLIPKFILLPVKPQRMRLQMGTSLLTYHAYLHNYFFLSYYHTFFFFLDFDFPVEPPVGFVSPACPGVCDPSEDVLFWEAPSPLLVLDEDRNGEAMLPVGEVGDEVGDWQGVAAGDDTSCRGGWGMRDGMSLRHFGATDLLIGLDELDNESLCTINDRSTNCKKIKGENWQLIIKLNYLPTILGDIIKIKQSAHNMQCLKVQRSAG